jgi:predicted DNA-binding protein
MATSLRNFHLPLPEPTYRRLRDAAERTNQPATALARHAIESWLREHRRTMVREAIARYAADVAGTREDLDEDLEAASLEMLREDAPRRTRREKKR